MVQVDESHPLGKIGRPIGNQGDGIRDAGMRDERHVALEFPVVKEGAIDVGDIDLCDHLKQVTVPDVPCIDVR